MFSLTLFEQEQIGLCSAAVHHATVRKNQAIMESSEDFGIAKAHLQSEIARLFAVVAAIEKRINDGTSQEPPF